MGGVESKSRDLGSDRGYRVVALIWAMLSLNPHPLKTKRVRHPKAILRACDWSPNRSAPSACGRDAIKIKENGRLVDPIVGAAGWVLFVFVDVDLEALFVALVFPIADGVADAVEEGAATQVNVSDQHAAEMADVCDVVSAAAERGEKFDGAHDGDVGAHGDRDRQRDEPDFAIGEEDGVRHENAKDCSGRADRRGDGKFVAEE